jgi:SP family general alpha glucoside:H+ symporter-like MFS transporter
MAPNVSELSRRIEQEVSSPDHREDIARIEKNPTLAKAIFHDAKEATETEHATTPLQGFKMYPKAVAWSTLITMAVVMDGYDETLLKSLFAEKAFQKQFGEPTKKGYQVTAPWQTGTTNAATIGIMLGICLNGLIRERVGMKRTMLASCIVLLGFVFILFFAQSPAMLLAGELLCGICWGIFHATAPIYASEVCPTVLRGYLTTFINMGAV